MAEMKSVQLLLLVLPLTGVTAVAPYTWLVALLWVNALSGQTQFFPRVFFLTRWGDGTGNYNEDNFWEPAYDEDYIEVL